MNSANACPMDTTSITCRKASAQTKGRFLLILSVLAILFFILYAGPRLEAVLGLKPVAHYIDERNIEANMYFYTEVEAFSEASINMDNIRAYPPQGPRPTRP